MIKKTLIVKILQVILGSLFASWLILFYNYHVPMNPDSYGYFADAKNLFDPAYVTIRPVLFPAYLRLMGNPDPKFSIITFLLNSISLLYLVYISGDKRRLFSGRSTIVLICFFLQTGIWSYCGTYLTESILFAVELWIFVFITKIILPDRKQPILLAILYSLLVSALAITLKPWIMIMVLLVSVLLFSASLILRSFRPQRLSSFILLAVGVLSFILTLPYNRSKSAESANMVVLMVTSGNAENLKARLKEDTGLSNDSADFIRSVVSDIELINGKYKGNPWVASATNELRYLNISDKKYVPFIKKAFHIMYFDHGKNTLGLVFLSFQRYISDLHMGLTCLSIAYGPELPGLRAVAIPLILSVSVLLFVYVATRRDPVDNKMAGIKRLPQFLKRNREVSIFTGIILIASVGFGLFLCLAGADELQRNVLPAVLFELFSLSYIILKDKT